MDSPPGHRAKMSFGRGWHAGGAGVSPGDIIPLLGSEAEHTAYLSHDLLCLLRIEAAARSNAASSAPGRLPGPSQPRLTEAAALCPGPGMEKARRERS